MSSPTGSIDLVAVVERAAELLTDGGHHADGDDVRAAAERVSHEVVHRLREGARGVDAAVNDTAQIVCDRLTTRLLQGRPLGGALHDVAVLHAVLELGYPASWFTISCLDGAL